MDMHNLSFLLLLFLIIILHQVSQHSILVLILLMDQDIGKISTTSFLE